MVAIRGPRGRYAAVAIVLIAAAAVTYQAWPRGFEPIITREGFEEGLSGWTAGADVPQDPNNPGNPVAHSITLSNQRSHEGSSSAKFTIDGLQDDGTIWLARTIHVPADATKVDLELQLYSDAESFNTIAVVVGYVGPRQPAHEEDLQVLGPANQAAGWRPYSLSVDAEPGEAWVALGISVRWETEVAYWVDSVRVTVR
jgi:hypothetical protein